MIPAAGFGTRFLPQTKAMPKEMLPIVDKPVIQYVVEELVDAGIRDIVMVTGFLKRAIEDHFDAPNAELINNLKNSGKDEMVADIKRISEMANFIYIRQKGPMGNATPLWNARHIIGDEPFLYFFGDDFIQAEPSRAKQLIAAYDKYQTSILGGIIKESDEDAKRYGYVKGEEVEPGVMKVSDVIEKPGEKPTHHVFIASGDNDPRPDFARELRKALGNKGVVLVYYQHFEKARLKEIAELFPEEAEWIEGVLKRMVDLYDPFKNFAYYHPSQKGSASLKRVLPALTGKSYDGMDISNGGEASLSYLYITHGSYDGKKATIEEIKKIRADLDRYCGQDTEGMIWILEKLECLIKEK